MLKDIKLLYLDLKYYVVKPAYNQIWLLIFFWPSFCWNNLWIRKDEFHKSLNLNVDAMLRMNDKQYSYYETNLVHRRTSAHERDLEKEC